MIPRRISGATHNLGAPKDWNPERDGDCCHLAVRVVAEPGTGCLFESAWEPTPAELKALNEGGSIVLRVIGGQPPVWLYVESFETGKPVEVQP